jgi:hypothetical protein
MYLYVNKHPPPFKHIHIELLHMHLCIYIHVYTHIYIHLYTYIYIYVYIYICIYIYIYKYKYMCRAISHMYIVRNRAFTRYLTICWWCLLNPKLQNRSWLQNPSPYEMSQNGISTKWNQSEIDVFMNRSL